MESLSAPHNVPAVLYIYTLRLMLMCPNCSQDGRTMQQNVVIDSSDANCYRKLLPADIKDYLSRIIGRHIN
ncbi:hypothetical protein GQ55_6G001000 [Panicum hallii var. hallii]|uniref:Uncharacterized protein n=1 Tax=Panicum hallii var. hallii TaxID=1504633 RepID=A0A2T7D2B6_9POAL|nr:hypothetical protein GQ55_6G001000 [Panicum hallii var. hallii]